MVIELSPELESLVEEQVKAGVYPSNSAVVSAAVAKMFSSQSADEVAESRSLVDEGVGDLDAGRFVEFTAAEISAEGRKAYNARHGLKCVRFRSRRNRAKIFSISGRTLRKEVRRRRRTDFWAHSTLRSPSLQNIRKPAPIGLKSGNVFAVIPLVIN